MNRIPYFSVISAIALLALTACAGPTVKVGSTKTTGDRVALYNQSHAPEADVALKDLKPKLSGPAGNTNWPQAGFDTSHALPNAMMSSHPIEIWSDDIGSGSNADYKILARPVVADGRVYTMDSVGGITAFDAQSGDEIWNFDTTPEESSDSAIGGGLGVDNGTLYATTGFGEVIALKGDDGSVLWRRMLPSPIRAAPTIASGHVYVVSIDNQMQVIDARSGDLQWKHSGISESAVLMGASNPAVANDNVIVAYSSGEIYDLRAVNGRASWNYTLGSVSQGGGALPAIADIRGLPVVDHGRVFAVSHSGRMASIDERSGERVWETEVGGINTPIVTGDTVFVLDNDAHLVAITRDTGRIIWVRDLPRIADPDDRESDPVYWTGPVLANDCLWLVNSAGFLISYSPIDGEEKDRFDIGEPIYVSPVVAGGILYIVADNGRLIALK